MKQHNNDTKEAQKMPYNNNNNNKKQQKGPTTTTTTTTTTQPKQRNNNNQPRQKSLQYLTYKQLLVYINIYLIQLKNYYDYHLVYRTPGRVYTI